MCCEKIAPKHLLSVQDTKVMHQAVAETPMEDATVLFVASILYHYGFMHLFMLWEKPIGVQYNKSSIKTFTISSKLKNPAGCTVEIYIYIYFAGTQCPETTILSPKHVRADLVHILVSEL